MLSAVRPTIVMVQLEVGFHLRFPKNKNETLSMYGYNFTVKNSCLGVCQLVLDVKLASS